MKKKICWRSNMYIFRLTKGNDLKKSIVEYARDNNIKSGVISACVG